MTKSLSIGLRLTLSYLLIFAVAQLVFGLGMWFILHHNLYDIADDTLEGQIDDVRIFWKRKTRTLQLASFRKQLTETYVLEHSGDYLQIQDEQGRLDLPLVILEAERFARNDADQLHKPLYEDRRVGEQSFVF